MRFRIVRFVFLSTTDGIPGPDGYQAGFSIKRPEPVLLGGRT